MLPDLPKLKVDLQKRMHEVAEREYRARNGLLGRIPRVHRHEGDRTSYNTVDGDLQEVQPEKHESKVEIPFADIPALDYPRAQHLMNEAYREVNDSISQSLFRVLDDMANKSGNILSAKGSELTQDMYLQMLEKIKIDMERSRGLSLVMHPSMADRLGPKLQEWLCDPQFHEKLKDLEFRKRSEWFDQESRRKLVD